MSPRSRRSQARTKGIVHDLNDELFTVTTTADEVASVTPEGSTHDDAVQIFAAGTRATADVVRLAAAIDAANADGPLEDAALDAK